MPVYRKASARAPTTYFAWEAAGLRWLAATEGGAPVVEVVAVGEHHLDLAALRTIPATQEAAAAFGAGLARTHAAGAPGYGSPPDGWAGDGWFGPLSEPLALSLRPHRTWGSFWAQERLAPITRVCRDAGAFSPSQATLLDAVADRCAAGEFDTGEPPARIHGDLWSGNVLWTDAGATLIDPSAHGGHREYDLAMLALFGAPFLGTVLAAYQQAAPLAGEWQQRVELHQLHALAVHALLFGGGYASQTVAAARRFS